MKLNYKTMGAGQPLIILHGLFGSLDNWMTIGKKFAENYQVFLLDGRNHGQSPHSDSFNYEIMAKDLEEFMMDLSIEDATVLGHSMGGKTTMAAALSYPSLFRQIIIVDMAPKSYMVHHRAILDGLLSLDFNSISSRSEADQKLSAYISEVGVRQFLLKSLYWKEKNQLALRFNLEVLNQEIEPISQWNDRTEQFDKPALFIRGGKSNYVDDNDPSIAVNFPNASLSTVANAGHWVHAEAPAELYQLVRHFMD